MFITLTLMEKTAEINTTIRVGDAGIETGVLIVVWYVETQDVITIKDFEDDLFYDVPDNITDLIKDQINSFFHPKRVIYL